MLKHILFAVLLLSLGSSKHEPTQQEICTKLDDSLKKYIEELTYKGNYKYRKYELKTIDFVEVSDNYIDSMKLNSNFQDYKNYRGLLESTIALAQLESSQADSYLEKVGKGFLWDLSKKDARKHLNEARQYKDSLLVIVARDCALKARIVSRKSSQKKYFKTRTFLKATIGNHHRLDTVTYILTKDFRPLSSI